MRAGVGTTWETLSRAIGTCSACTTMLALAAVDVSPPVSVAVRETV